MKENKEKKDIKVLYGGNFKQSHYPRGMTLYKGLLKNNVDIKQVLAHDPIGYVKLFFEILKKNYDVIMVTGKPIFLMAFLTKFWHRKKILFDVFISDYENLVLNRKKVKAGSIFAKFIWSLDKYSCLFSDFNILDTEFHIDYFCETYKLDRKKFDVVFVGADDELFYPRNPKTQKEENKVFKVAFYGSFIPGHGIDIMLKAAKLLERENVVFDFIGYGPMHAEMVALSKKISNKNVSFLGWIDFKELPSKLAEYDACLGLFDGDIPKVQRVIPTKVFEILAMKLPVITGENIAMTHYFRNKENTVLCKMSSPSSLAKEIKWLSENKEQRDKIAENGYTFYKKNFTPINIGRKLKKIILNLI